MKSINHKDEIINIINILIVAIAQLGERKTEDLEVTGSIPVCDNN